MPLSVARVYLFTIWTDETLLSADFCWVEVISKFRVTIVEMRLVGGGHTPVTLAIERRISVTLFDVTKRYADLAVRHERGPVVVGGGGGRCCGGSRGSRTGSTWRTLVAPVVHRARGDDEGRKMEEQIKGGVKEEAEPV